MAGKLCAGRPLGNAGKIQNTLSYAAGRTAAANGATLDDNPHTPTTRPESDFAFWAGGFYSYFEGSPEYFIRDCCAEPKGGGFGSGSVAFAVAADPADLTGSTAGEWYAVTFTVTIDGNPAPFFRVGITPRVGIEFRFANGYELNITDQNGEVVVEFMSPEANSTTLTCTASDARADVPFTAA
jgi:hypothetical protein